jgi:type I restriction enzyme S subunit
MKALLEKIDLKNIDKSNWESFRFEEIAKRVSETVDPNTTTLEKYVGLEHIDAEDIHIKRFGTPADVSGGKLKCYPGDVIFGKRRAYQRKAAIVDFEGICSAHAFVFRATPGVIDPKLFSFFLHSDQFMHRAVDISVGGLSPTINWGDLKGQQFLLPPKDEQVCLAELLGAMDEVIEKEKGVLGRLLDYKSTSIESLLNGQLRVNKSVSSESTVNTSIGKFPESWKVLRLKDILIKARLGGNYTNSESEAGLPLIKMGNLSRGNINLEKLQYVPEDIDYNSEDVLRNGDLLFNTRNTLELVGKVAIWKNELPKALYNSNIMRFEFKKEIIAYNDFMNFVFNSRRGIKQLRSFATGTTSVAAIYAPDLMRFRCAIPPIEEQIGIVNIVNSLNDSINICKSKLMASQSLQKSLINQIF